jgi:hypothetical protein
VIEKIPVQPRHAYRPFAQTWNKLRKTHCATPLARRFAGTLKAVKQKLLPDAPERVRRKSENALK